MLMLFLSVAVLGMAAFGLDDLTPDSGDDDADGGDDTPPAKPVSGGGEGGSHDGDSDGDGGGSSGEDGDGGNDGPAPDDPFQVNGGFGSERFDLRNETQPMIAQLHEGGDTFLSGSGDTTVYAGSGPDRVVTGSGADHVYLGDGRDSWSEGLTSGDDLVRGGNGNDKLEATSGSDLLYGDLGADVLNAVEGDPLTIGHGLSKDIVYGGYGSDTLKLDDGDRGFGGAKDDTFIVNHPERHFDTPGSEGAVRGEPVFIGDFNPSEDNLVLQLPSGLGASFDDLELTGEDGERLTIWLRDVQIVVLDGVDGNALTDLNVLLK